MTQGVPDVTISVVLYNSRATLTSLASTLQRPTAQGIAEVVAVDNASSDGSADGFARLFPDARLIRNPENRGYAAANNQTWPFVRGRYWLLLNPDVAAEGSAIGTLIAWMDARPDVGVASPLLLGADGARETVARPLPSLGWRMLEMLRLHHLRTREARSTHLMGPYWTGADRIRGWVPGAAMILRRSAVERVGLLTERSFIYGEDLELCWRMHRHGWAVGVCRDCEFVHAKGASAGAVWTDEEIERRIAIGELAVVGEVKGRHWMRLYGCVVGVSHLLEGLHPRRSRDERKLNRRIGRTWLASARR